jgi:hypothetical protein
MKVKFGALVVDGRGKIGGHVMSKNRSGAYMRTKVTPTNPNTAAQSAVRSILTGLSQAWRGLTQAQRNAWNGAVSSFATTDIFGDIKNPSGINLYVKLNANLAEIGVSAISLPPLPESVPAPILGAITATAGTPAFTVAFSPTPIAADTSYIIRATAQVSPGKKFVKNLYRNVQIVAAAGTSPANILSAYVAKFGTLVEGQKIGIEILAVNENTGQKSTAYNGEVIVAA